MTSRLLLAVVLAASVLAGCTDDSAPAPTVPPTQTATSLAPLPPPSTTGATAAPATSPPEAAATTAAPPPPVTVAIEGDLPEGLGDAVAAVYERLAGSPAGDALLAPGLAAYLGTVEAATGAETRTATSTEAMLPSGESVAVVRVDGDVLFAAGSEGEWRVVGVALHGEAPWLMDEPGFLLVIGSDARPGQLQPRFRADSIHVLALAPSADAGTIVGFPRDTYISAELIAEANEVVGLAADDLPPGAIKWTNLMAGRGPEIMLETARALTGLPITGYVLTGFLGFDALISELGGLRITLATDLATGNNWEPFPAGSQLLNPTRALQLARIRKALRGGDFARSLNQGLIMIAAMTMVQRRNIDALPTLVQILAENTFTDLDAGELLAFSAAGLLQDPGNLGNVVLPGDVATIDGRSVVLLHEEDKDRIIGDVADDGVVETGS